MILLTDVLNIDAPENYKIHLANWNGDNQPLDVFVQDREQWHAWNSWRGSKDDFNRQYIFSLIDYYHEPNAWLFGGVYEVHGRGVERHAHSYKIDSHPLLASQFYHGATCFCVRAEAYLL